MMLLWIQLLLLFVQTHSFTVHLFNSQTRLGTTAIHSKKPKKGRSKASNNGGGKGFGKSAKSIIKVRQTYGSTQQPKDAFIDIEAAMGNFFRSKEEWHPLFASIASSDDVPASEFLKVEGGNGQDLLFDDETPWEKLPQVPSGDNKDDLMAIIAKVLDSSQQALVEIPVNEALKEDENDLHFIEEGRRILCLNRFQVLPTDEYLSFTSTLERHDKIFSLVWSEIYHLMKEDVADSGSLVILPDVYDIADLKQFTDLNVLRPLEWLGIKPNVLEVASLQRDSPCIRLLHKLSDIPSLETRDTQLAEEEEE